MRRKKIFSEEDRSLWHKVTQTVRPLSPASESDTASLKTQTNLSRKGKKGIGLSSSKADRPAVHRAPLPSVKAPNQKLHEAGDPKTFKRLSRERIPIEATLDLHGLSQDQAYATLTAFLQRATTQGLRTVLVITGKGPVEGRENVHYHNSRGILRHRFLQWAEHNFEEYISALRPAHTRHGGLGAFYVTLKRKGRPASRR